MRSYFDRVFGNEENRRQIGAGIEEGILPHAILLEGGDGSGRATFASEIAAALLCEHRRDPQYPLPCHCCETCRKVAERLCTDVTRIGRGERATIGVDPIRDIRSDMFLSPTETDEKIYIIEDADAMTPQAQNALLVALEEPPAGVRILLLADRADAMLTTVRSRVRLYRMARFSPAEMDLYLSRHSAEAASLKAADRTRYDALLQGADGRIGKVLDMLDPATGEVLMSARETVDGVIGCVAAASGYAAICDATAKFHTASRAEWTEELELLLTALRDLTLRKKSAEAPLLYYTDPGKAEALASRIPMHRLFRLLDAVTETLDRLDRNGNTSILLATLRDRLKNA